jgi:predicted ATPase
VLTKIEIDGFKTFRGFELDLQPLTVIAGANASGKSNLLDAIQFLARLAESDLREAARDLRGEPHELFHRAPGGKPVDQIKLAAEVLVEPTVKDPWGQEHELSQTRLRYEVTLEWRVDRGTERPFVVGEAAKLIRAGTDVWAKPFKHHPLIGPRLKYNSRKKDLLETVNGEGDARFVISYDGHAGRKRPVVAAEATVLSSITSVEFAHLFALREELRSWRFLQLDPESLRSAVDALAPPRLATNGSNLATVLARIQAETATDDDEMGLLTDLSADLAHLVPGIRGVRVLENVTERKWQVLIRTRDGGEYSSRVASDGTLRLLAVLTALNDPRFGGLVCLEEPENGVHPARLRTLMEHLRGVVKDAGESGDAIDAPLLQLILTTHSPVVVATLEAGEGFFFEAASSLDGSGGGPDVVTRARVLRREIQQTLDPGDVGHLVTNGEVERYLATVDSE